LTRPLPGDDLIECAPPSGGRASSGGKGRESVPNIYYDPYADALREIAELNAAVAGSEGDAKDGETLKAMLRHLVEGGTLSQDDERQLSILRARYLRPVA
jgi:hypothetical protein